MQHQKPESRARGGCQERTKQRYCPRRNATCQDIGHDRTDRASNGNAHSGNNEGIPEKPEYKGDNIKRTRRIKSKKVAIRQLTRENTFSSSEHDSLIRF